MVFAALLLIRALLPIGVRAWVNHALASGDGYRGDVGNIDLNLWRGAYEIERLRMFKVAGERREPFLEIPRLDLSVQWAALLQGRIVTEATLHQPTAHFVTAKREAEEQTGEEASWSSRLDKLTPFYVNRLTVRDGEIRFRDLSTEPFVDAFVTDFYLEALNVAFVREEGPTGDATANELPAEVEAAGRPFGTAEFEARLRFDPLADPLRFELDASLSNLHLIAINDFLEAYGGIDAEAGTLGLYMEFAGAKGRTEGYVKTLFEDMRLLRPADLSSPGAVLETVWEALVAGAGEILENQPYDRLATKIPLRSTGEGTSADVFETIGNLLRNGFLAALGPAIDDTISLRDMEIAAEDEGAGGRTGEHDADQGGGGKNGGRSGEPRGGRSDSGGGDQREQQR